MFDTPNHTRYLDREYYKAKYDAEYAKLKTDLALAKYAPIPAVPLLTGVAGITKTSTQSKKLE